MWDNGFAVPMPGLAIVALDSDRTEYVEVGRILINAVAIKLLQLTRCSLKVGMLNSLCHQLKSSPTICSNGPTRELVLSAPPIFYQTHQRPPVEGAALAL